VYADEVAQDLHPGGEDERGGMIGLEDGGLGVEDVVGQEGLDELNEVRVEVEDVGGVLLEEELHPIILVLFDFRGNEVAILLQDQGREGLLNVWHGINGKELDDVVLQGNIDPIQFLPLGRREIGERGLEVLGEYAGEGKGLVQNVEGGAELGLCGQFHALLKVFIFLVRSSRCRRGGAVIWPLLGL